jgi:hypothetical protein
MTNRLPGDKTPVKRGAIDPADANFSWHWIQEVITKLGWVLVVIDVDTFINETMSEAVGEKLAMIQLAQLDSAQYINGSTRLFFYAVAKRLAEALQMLKAEMEALKLPARVRIGYADSQEKVWREFCGPEIKV